MRAAVLLLVGACTTRGTVDVVAPPGSLIVFADQDGTSRRATTDDNGHASGEIEAGGSVWHIELTNPSMTNEPSRLTAYADVEPGASLEFGILERPVVATMPISATVPPLPTAEGPVAWRAYSSCSPRTGVRNGELVAFDDRCGLTGDVLVVATESLRSGSQRPYAYVFRPGTPIINGSTLAIRDDEWHPMDRVSVRLTGGATWDQLAELRFSNSFFEGVDLTQPEGDTLSLALPLVGDVQLSGRLASTTGAVPQELKLRLDRSASHVVDLHAVLAPWVFPDSIPPNQSRTWTMDDVGGALRADAMVIEHEWNQPIANYEQWVHTYVVSAMHGENPVGPVRLPDAVAGLRPGPGFLVNTNVRLVRVERGLVNPLRAAERMTARFPLFPDLEPGTSSVAITSTY